MLRTLARVAGLVIFVTAAADVQGRESPQDIPVSVTAITAAGLRHMGNMDLRALTQFTPSIRFGQTLADGRNIQVRGALNSPGYYIDGVPINFDGQGIDLSTVEPVEVLRGPQSTLFGNINTDPQSLADIAQVFASVLDAQQVADKPLLDVLRGTQRQTEFATGENSGLLSGTDNFALCSPEQFRFLKERSFVLEFSLQKAAIDRFNAQTGMDFATQMDEQDLATGFDNLRYNADMRLEGFKLQFDALYEYARQPLQADCEPAVEATAPTFSWLDVLDSTDFGRVLGSAAPTGTGDTGSRTPRGFNTDITGEVWAPDNLGKWMISRGYSFANSDAIDRLQGMFSGRCADFEGPERDQREYAFSSALAYNIRNGFNLDLSFPLGDTKTSTAQADGGNQFQRNYADTLDITRRRLCDDPLDYSYDLGFKLNLTNELFTRASRLGYSKQSRNIEPTYDTRGGDVRLEYASQWDLRLNSPSPPDQTGYDTVPNYRYQNESLRVEPNFPNYSATQRLNYNGALSYTFPNIAPNDAFMPDCFEPQHYGTFRIGANEYVRVFIDPQLIARLDMQGLEVAGVFLDPLRGPLTDPYMQPVSAGGGAWGQSYDDQWAIKKVGFTSHKLTAWVKLDSQSTHPVVIAVIDTGLDWHHQDISANSIWRNADEIPGNGIDDDNNGYTDDVMGYDFMERDGKPWDTNGHGTLVSGIIAATRNNDIGIAGINPDAQIMVLRVSNSFGNTNASYIGEAITYAADNGANIINISMGGANRSRLETAAIAYALEKGVLVVAAAGNEGTTLDDYGPGAEEGVLTVAATDLNDEHAEFSNTGEAVDIAAPGIDVLGLRARGTDANLSAKGDAYALGDYFVGTDNRYIRASGTSFATPIVTGAASALLALNPGLSAQDIKQRLIATAWDVGKPGHDDKTGAGLLDARTALSVDQSFFIDASIGRFIPNAGSETLEIYGRADADHFKRAWLQIGEGVDPQTWKYVGLKLKRPVQDAILSEIPLSEFDNTGVWTVRINVEHKSGTVRRATKVVRLK